MDICLDGVRKMNLHEGDIVIMPNTFSSEMKAILRAEINLVYPGKNIGIMFADNPDAIRIIKTSGIAD